MRVLVVEDERQLADTVAKGLRRAAMAVDVAYDGDDAWDRLTLNEYDVVILDRDLPGKSGDAICRDLIDSGICTRIIMLTAASALLQKIDGLDLGADDYLGKPFAFEELVARVRALGRRAPRVTPPVLARGSLRVDTNRRQVTRAGTPVELTRKEFAVLVELLRAEGGVVSAEQLLEKAWDDRIDSFSGVVRFTILMLRRKLGDPGLVETVFGEGYRIS